MRKKTSKLIISLMVACTILFAFSISGFALSAVKSSNSEPTVTLNKTGNEKVGFSFNRDNADLFDNFKGVMPGDKLTQDIYVENKADGISGSTSFEIYLYAENGEISNLVNGKTPDDLFSKIKFKVNMDGKELELKKTDDNVNGVNLGNFDLNESKKLQVTMEVPIELGNEYQNAEGKINWYFYAQQGESEDIVDPDVPLDNSPEDKPVKPSDEKTPPLEEIKDEAIPLESIPKTNDNSSLIFFGVIALVAVAGVVSLNVVRKKKKN